MHFCEYFSFGPSGVRAQGVAAGINIGDELVRATVALILEISQSNPEIVLTGCMKLGRTICIRS